MEIVEAKCWSCGSPMKIALIELYGPERFTDKEIEFASSKGVLIEEKFSGTMQKSYLANTCPKCGSFVGQFHIDDYEGGGKRYPLP